MLNFDELNQEQLAALTESELNEYVKVELMKEGLDIAVEDPGEYTVPSPKLKTTKYYTIEVTNGYSSFGDLYFRTLSQAEKFIALQPMTHGTDWDAGREFKFMVQKELVISAVELYDENEVRENLPVIIKYKESKKIHSEKANNYKQWRNRRNNIYSKIYDAWRKAVEKQNSIDKVKTTWSEYLTLANGDSTVAMAFLEKAYGTEAIAAAGIENA